MIGHQCDYSLLDNLKANKQSFNTLFNNYCVQKRNRKLTFNDLSHDFSVLFIQNIVYDDNSDKFPINK